MENPQEGMACLSLTGSPRGPRIWAWKCRVDFPANLISLSAFNSSARSPEVMGNTWAGFCVRMGFWSQGEAATILFWRRKPQVKGEFSRWQWG